MPVHIKRLYFRYKRHIYAFCTLLLVSLISLLPSCKPEIIADAKPHYYDLKAYFKAEAARLTKLNKLTSKTVIHNDVTESKKVHISNWQQELSLFSESDINKPAWRESYTEQVDSNFTIYTTKDTTLTTKSITISKQGNKIKWIMIRNFTKNILYQTNEKLSYFPDSAYIIEKSQHVKILGTNHYTIKGLFN